MAPTRPTEPEPPGSERAPAREDLLDHATLDALARLLARRPGGLRAMMDDYLSSAERHLSRIDDALAKGDAAAARESAHSFKGVSGQMGSKHVMAVAYRVEKAAAAGDVAGARSLLDALRAAHEAARPALLDACEARGPARVPST